MSVVFMLEHYQDTVQGGKMGTTVAAEGFAMADGIHKNSIMTFTLFSLRAGLLSLLPVKLGRFLIRLEPK